MKTRKKLNRWARYFDECINCHTTQRKHNARGLCVNCYVAEHAKTPREKARRKAYNQEYMKDYVEKYRKLLNAKSLIYFYNNRERLNARRREHGKLNRGIFNDNKENGS